MRGARPYSQAGFCPYNERHLVKKACTMRRWLLVLVGWCVFNVGACAGTVLPTHRAQVLRVVSPYMPVRIMPLGDSITYGVKSHDGGGYRTRLWHLLQQSGTAVDFVGSLAAGPADIDQD